MYRLPKEQAMTLPLLQEFLDKHRNEARNRYKKLKNAYESDHEILHQAAKPKYKPDNRIVVNFPKYIVDTMNGFFIGNPIKTTSTEDKVAEFVEYLDQYNDQDDKNAELSKLCSIYGKGYELYYTDEQAELCTANLSPVEAFMIFDDGIIETPLFFVRRYTDNDNNEWGFIYDSVGYRKFKVTGGLRWVDEDWTPHRFDGVPATEFVENAERQGLFEPVMSIVNAYNKAISEKANDVDYFADAYLKVLGPKVEAEDVKFIRDNRVVNFEGDGSDKIVVEFMGKPESDTAQENHLNRLERLVFQISMVANISDENFGSSSGIALRYKLQAMSNLEKTKERKFTSGMNRRYKLLFSHPASKVPADSWVMLKYKFTQNLPANLLEEAQIAAQMAGITSQETQLKVLSIIDDVQEEIGKIEAEQEKQASHLDMYGGFGEHSDEDKKILHPSQKEEGLTDGQ